MSTKSPIFPIHEPQHFSDYGFDPQFDYFQVLEEARKHKRENCMRSIDALHFKLQKPISKDDSSKKIKKNRKRWWRNALLFFKSKLGGVGVGGGADAADLDGQFGSCQGRRSRIGSISGPVYITESSSGSSTPYRTHSSRMPSGPLAGILTPAMKGDAEIPYISLRDVSMDHQGYRISASAMPIYLVT